MSLFTPNTDTVDNYYDKGKYTLAWRLSLFFTLVFVLLTFISFSHLNEETIVYTICSSIGVSALFFLSKTKKYKLVYYFLSISGSLIAFYTLNNFDTFIHYGDFLWIILIIIISFFGIGIKYGFIILTTNLFTILYYILFSLNTNIENTLTLNNIELIGVGIEILVAILSISYVFYQFVIFHKHSYDHLRERNTIISTQNNENTILVKEIHHRVKNNLQIIISLLRLQKGELKSEEAKKHFSEAINRIMVMSLIHKKLYQDKELAHLNIEAYLTDLANDIKSISELKIPLTISVSSEIKNVGLKTIVPLGLIVNELISNSLKHAFIDKQEGTISISIYKSKNDLILLDYTDNGTWNESDESKSSFGLELIDILTTQIEGSYTRNESTYNFTLKNLDI